MKDTFRLLGHDVDSEKFAKIIDQRVTQLLEYAGTKKKYITQT